jgi:zinc transport system substrate-binding protein
MKNYLFHCRAKRPFVLLMGFCLLISVFIMPFALNSVLYAQQSPRIAAASYPVWLFTRYLNYGRDYFSVELMTNPETGCPHEFNPQPRDLERLTQTKILVENGLNLEIYLDRALRVAPKDIFIIDASKAVPTLILSYGRITIPEKDLLKTPCHPIPIFFFPLNLQVK